MSRFLQLCQFLDEDNQRRRELEAQQFATYIQQQGKEGPDQEASSADMSSKLFPQGNFVDEITFEETTLPRDDDASNEVPFQLLNGRTSMGRPTVKKQTDDIPQWNFKPNQIERFKELMGNIFHLIEAKKRSNPSSDISLECTHDRTLLTVCLLTSHHPCSS